MTRKEKALDFFEQRYNCAQSIFLAYSGQFNIDRDLAAKLTSNLGGGIAVTQRHLCGTVIGAVLVIGCKFGNTNPKDVEAKDRVKSETLKFLQYIQDKHRSCDCGALLEEDAPTIHPRHFVKCFEMFDNVCDYLDKLI